MRWVENFILILRAHFSLQRGTIRTDFQTEKVTGGVNFVLVVFLQLNQVFLFVLMSAGDSIAINTCAKTGIFCPFGNCLSLL